MFKHYIIILLLSYMGNVLPRRLYARLAPGFNPPSKLIKPLARVREYTEETHPNYANFKNFNWDQIIANGGKLNYCVRWDSPEKVTVADRDKIQRTLQQEIKKWTDKMIGQNGWPFKEVPVKVVGWAVRDRSQLLWNDQSVDIYVNDIYEDAPQCVQTCGRFFNRNGEYPNCPGGAERHYDQSLWLTKGLAGAAAGDWGQRLDSIFFMKAINTRVDIHVITHEMGHSFGLLDFYDFKPIETGFIMKAGSSKVITEFDTWMLRSSWNDVKSRYVR